MWLPKPPLHTVARLAKPPSFHSRKTLPSAKSRRFRPGLTTRVLNLKYLDHYMRSIPAPLLPDTMLIARRPLHDRRIGHL